MIVFELKLKRDLRGRMVEVFSIFSIERRAATPTIRRTIYGRDARLV
jgi:hypothetical protein